MAGVTGPSQAAYPPTKASVKVPQSCEICNKSFMLHRTLANHMKKQHKINPPPKPHMAKGQRGQPKKAAALEGKGEAWQEQQYPATYQVVASFESQPMTPDTAKVKCRNFLATLLRLASDQPELVVHNVRALIQGLIDGRVEPEVFTTKLQKELNSAPQPGLAAFLKKSLPYLQYSLATRELSLEGVVPPTITQVGKLPSVVSAPSVEGPASLPRMAPPFNWPMRLKQIDDDTHHLHIPPDITFKILEDDVKHKVDAHKMVLAMVSPVFHRMFIVLEGGSKEIFVEGTTPAAFKIMKNAIYNVMSMEKSLEGKSATEVFAVLDLVRRYQIRELKKIVLDHLASFSLADDTVLEVAATAMKRSRSSEFGGQGLFLRCAKFLRSKFVDAQAVFQYLADHKEQKEVIHELLVVMKDLDHSTNSVKRMDASNESVTGFVSDSSKQCVTPVKFRGKTAEEIEAMGDEDKLEYTLHENFLQDSRSTLHLSMKSVPVTTNIEDENLASHNKFTNDTVKRKREVSDSPTMASKINIMDMSDDDLSEGETIMTINKRRPRSGHPSHTKSFYSTKPSHTKSFYGTNFMKAKPSSSQGWSSPNHGVNRVQESNLRSEWSAGSGEVEKAPLDRKDDFKDKEDLDEKMKSFVTTKKAKLTLSKSSTSTL